MSGEIPSRTLEIAPERRPPHIAIIMDGNGRWAKQRGLPRIEGHRRGVETVRTTTFADESTSALVKKLPNSIGHERMSGSSSLNP